ncbi:MAG: hypothetical protein QXL24_03425 [Candidatus Jordarchaeaceae archaeon]
MKFCPEKFVRSRKGILIILLLVLASIILGYVHGSFYPVSLPNSLQCKDGESLIGYRGEEVEIVVRMVNSTHPIVGELTLFYDQPNGLVIGDAFTNSSGHAVLHWGVPSDYNLGATIIKAYCPQRPDTIPVYVNLLIKSRTSFGNLTYPTIAYPREYLVIEVNLLDNNNCSIPSQIVRLYDSQNTCLNSSVTDIFGHCTLFWQVPQSITLGQGSFRIKFEGSEVYDPVESGFNVTFVPPPSKIVLIALNATQVKPNEPIRITVKINSSDPLFSVRINGYELQRVGGDTWTGIITAHSSPGKYMLTVTVYYNGVQCANDSSTYYIVGGEASELPATSLLLLLLIFSRDNSFGERFVFIAPISGLAVACAFIAWKRRERHPDFATDYTGSGEYSP